MRPTHRIVVVRIGRAESILVRDQEFGRHERFNIVQVRQFIEGPTRAALGAGAVVADNVIDQCVVEDLKVCEGVDQPPDVIVSMFQEAGVHFHFACQHRYQLGGHLFPGRDLRVTRRQLRFGRDHAQLLLAGEGLFTQFVPALIEFAFVLIGPLCRHVVRGMGGAGGKVDKERLVGHERLLLAHPVDGLVGHVLGEMVALFRSLLWLDRMRAFEQAGIVLVGLTADEAIEVFKTAARGGPVIERPQRAGLPNRHFVALAELRRGVAVQLERLGQRRAGVGPHRAIAGR